MSIFFSWVVQPPTSHALFGLVYDQRPPGAYSVLNLCYPQVANLEAVQWRVTVGMPPWDFVRIQKKHSSKYPENYLEGKPNIGFLEYVGNTSSEGDLST